MDFGLFGDKHERKLVYQSKAMEAHKLPAAAAALLAVLLLSVFSWVSPVQFPDSQQ